MSRAKCPPTVVDFGFPLRLKSCYSFQLILSYVVDTNVGFSMWWVYIEFLSWLLFSKGGCNNGSFLHLCLKNLITVSDVQNEDAISSTMPDVESPSSSITICSFVIFKFSWIVYWVWYIIDIWRVVSIWKINISLNRGPSVGPSWEVGIDQGKIMVWGEIIQVLIFSKTELQNGISNVG